MGSNTSMEQWLGKQYLDQADKVISLNKNENRNTEEVSALAKYNLRGNIMRQGEQRVMLISAEPQLAEIDYDEAMKRLSRTRN